MTQLKLSGSLQAGPPTVTDGSFPATTVNAPISTKENPKTYQAATGVLRRTLNYVAFTDLGTVGAGAEVEQGTFLYFRSDAAVELRLTTDDGGGGNEVAILPVDGLCILEFDSTQFLKLLEMNGSATIEYFISGPS